MSTARRFSFIRALIVFLGLSFVCLFSFVGETTFSAGSKQESLEILDRAAVEAFSDEFFSEIMSEKYIPGLAFVIVKDGELLYQKGYGYADVENRMPVDPEATIFRIASVSKLFTTVAVLQLVEEGIFDLDADVNRYLSEFKIPDNYPKPITLRHLLTHTAGFEDQDVGFLVHHSEEMTSLGAYLKTHLPARVMPPGEVYAYSNYGMTLVGYLVEKGAGMPFEQYVAEHIFSPLDMQASTFNPNISLFNLARGYAVSPDQTNPVTAGYPTGGVSPQGGMTATAVDIAHFMISMLEEGSNAPQILGRETKSSMLDQQFTHHELLPGTGFGFIERIINGRRVLYHDGDTEGFGSEMVLVPEAGLGYFLTYNTYRISVREPFAAAFFNHFFAEAVPAQTANGPSQPLDPTQYEGAYRSVRYNQALPSKLILLTELNVTVAAQPDGTLSLNYFGLLNGQNGVFQYEPLAPHVFRKVDTSGGGDASTSAFDPGEFLVFRESTEGVVDYLFIPLRSSALEKVKPFEGIAFQTYLTAALLVIFLSPILAWTIGWLVSKLRRVPAGGKSGPRAAQALGIAVSLINITFVVLFFPQILEIKYGVSDLTRALLWLPVLSSLLTLGMAWWMLKMWQGSLWRFSGRFHYTVLTAAGFVFSWWAYYWNLYGYL